MVVRSHALIHRPDFRLLQRDSTSAALLPHDPRARPSMWISYAPLNEIVTDKHRNGESRRCSAALPRQLPMVLPVLACFLPGQITPAA